MLRTSLDRCLSRRTAATVAATAIGVVGLIPLAAAPASADGSPPVWRWLR